MNYSPRGIQLQNRPRTCQACPGWCSLGMNWHVYMGDRQDTEMDEASVLFRNTNVLATRTIWSNRTVLCSSCQTSGASDCFKRVQNRQMVEVEEKQEEEEILPWIRSGIKQKQSSFNKQIMVNIAVSVNKIPTDIIKKIQ